MRSFILQIFSSIYFPNNERLVLRLLIFDRFQFESVKKNTASRLDCGVSGVCLSLELLNFELSALLNCFVTGGFGDAGGEGAGLDDPVVIEVEHFEVALGIDLEGDGLGFTSL